MSNNQSKKPHIIVLGNEKGGTGKSTVAMHVAISLVRSGYKVGCIDVDARQGTLSQGLNNRSLYVQANKRPLPIPTFYPVHRSTYETKSEIEADEMERLVGCLMKLSDHDYVVIDTPGSDMYLSRIAHSYADTLVTPLNDSLLDLDMLVRLKLDAPKQLRPSVYAEAVWEQRKQRLMRDGGSIDWIVLRNRLSTLNARNKIEMERILSLLANRIGFRLVPGFGERVIFRELFLQGLTLLDLEDIGANFTMSHVAARQELRGLMQAILNPPSPSHKLEKKDPLHASA